MKAFHLFLVLSSDSRQDNLLKQNWMKISYLLLLARWSKKYVMHDEQVYRCSFTFCYLHHLSRVAEYFKPFNDQRKVNTS